MFLDSMSHNAGTIQMTFHTAKSSLGLDVSLEEWKFVIGKKSMHEDKGFRWLCELKASDRFSCVTYIENY